MHYADDWRYRAAHREPTPERRAVLLVHRSAHNNPFDSAQPRQPNDRSRRKLAVVISSSKLLFPVRQRSTTGKKACYRSDRPEFYWVDRAQYAPVKTRPEGLRGILRRRAIDRAGCTR